jgi:AraC-like DNA-binding protein
MAGAAKICAELAKLLKLTIWINIPLMLDILKTPWFSLELQSEPELVVGEHLNDNNPFAKSVAEPLFTAKVICLGLVCRKEYNTDDHTPEYHDIRVLLQGSMKASYDVGEVEVKPGEILYIPPKMNRKYTSDSNEVTWWLYVKIEDTPNWEELKKKGPFVEIFDATALMFILLRRVIDAFKSRDLKSMNSALGESQMLLRLLRGLIQEKKLGIDQRIWALRDLVGEIAKNPEFHWSHANMARKLHTSSRTLIRIFKSEYGCTPIEMVYQKRLNHALTLLSTSNKGIEEVAERCGYENVSSFSRAFRKKVGMTPGKYRKISIVEK